MSSKWKQYTIKDACDLITGFPFKSKSYLNEGTFKVVRGDNVKTGFIQWGEKTKCWNQISEKLEKYLLKENDIVIGMDGSKVGENRAIIGKNDLPSLLAQRVACLRSKKHFNQNYIKYVILSKNFQYYVDMVKTGTSIPHISLTQISEFPFNAPDYEKQTVIANILLQLDNKININKKINHNLIIHLS